MEGERYPSMERYLGALPGGLDAHPRAQAKGAVLRMAIDDTRLALPPASLPEVLAAYFTTPPAVNAWIPEVHFNALMLAVYEEHFARAGGTVAYESWILERNRKLLRTPLFRILFAVVSPERLLIGVENRWAAFRRGSQMVVLSHTNSSAELSFRHPEGLATDISARGLRVALRAALELAGAREVDLTYVLTSPEETRYSGRWTK